MRTCVNGCACNLDNHIHSSALDDDIAAGYRRRSLRDILRRFIVQISYYVFNFKSNISKFFCVRDKMRQTVRHNKNSYKKKTRLKISKNVINFFLKRHLSAE